MIKAIQVLRIHLLELEKVTEQTKAMMESWMVNETPVKNSSKEFNPGLPMMPNNVNDHRRPNGFTQKDYQDYGWLFGGGRR